MVPARLNQNAGENEEVNFFSKNSNKLEEEENEDFDLRTDNKVRSEEVHPLHGALSRLGLHQYTSYNPSRPDGLIKLTAGALLTDFSQGLLLGRTRRFFQWRPKPLPVLLAPTHGRMGRLSGPE